MRENTGVTVVGVGDDGWHGLTDEARAVLREAPAITTASRSAACASSVSPGQPSSPMPTTTTVASPLMPCPSRTV